MVAAELLGAIFSVVSSGSAIQGLDARDFGLGDGFALEAFASLDQPALFGLQRLNSRVMESEVVRVDVHPPP